jgi:hypothetical protein
MGSFQIPIRTSGISQLFSDFPEPLKDTFRTGFQVLQANETSISELVPIALDSLVEKRQSDLDDVAARYKLSDKQAEALLATITLLAGLAVYRDEAHDDIFEEAISANVLVPANRAAAQSFLTQAKTHRSTILQSLRETEIAEEVLPALQNFETSVDLRLGFEKGKIEMVVPVVMVHIETDASDFWLQMKKQDVEEMISHLEGLLQEINEAEKWAAGAKK